MSYKITLNKPIPRNQTEKNLDKLAVKIFDYGSSKFFSYNDKFFELLEDKQNNVVGLTIHGNSIADFRTLMNIKEKIFLENGPLPD